MNKSAGNPVVTQTGVAASTESKGPVSVRVVRDTETEALLEISVNYEKADVPDRAYYADYVDVVQGRYGFSLFFGKLSYPQGTLRNKVEISIPLHSFVRQLWNGSREFHAALMKEYESKQLIPVILTSDTDKVQSFTSNNVFMSKLGDEATLDFYFIPPSEVNYFHRGHRTSVDLQPVIRIVVPTPVVLELLGKCDEHAKSVSNLDDILKGRG